MHTYYHLFCQRTLLLSCKDLMMPLDILPSLEKEKNVAIPEYVINFIRKKKLCISRGHKLMWYSEQSLSVTQKSSMLNSRDEGKESLPWIQNQILWDLLEFTNKHLQTLLIQYSIWPTLPSCFPIRLGSNVAWEKPQQRADISVNMKGHIRWPRKCHSSKCKSGRLQDRRRRLGSGQHKATTGHPCSSNRGNTLGSSPSWLKRLVEKSRVYSWPI